jgi:hypothetical protein
MLSMEQEEPKRKQSSLTDSGIAGKKGFLLEPNNIQNAILMSVIN